jgi:hypothetical protein
MKPTPSPKDKATDGTDSNVIDCGDIVGNVNSTAMS